MGQKFTSVMCDFDPFCLFSICFQGALAVTIILIDVSENAIVSWVLNFRGHMVPKSEISRLSSEGNFESFSLLFFQSFSNSGRVDTERA